MEESFKCLAKCLSPTAAEHIISVLQNSLLKKYMNVLVAYVNFPQSTGHVSKIKIYIPSLKKNGNEFLPVEMLSLILR
jgi:hypothetical protein